MSARLPLAKLTAVLAARIRADSAAGAESQAEYANLQRALQLATANLGPVIKPPHAYAAVFAAAIAEGLRQRHAVVAAALADVGDLLPWGYHYAHRSGEDNLAARIAFAELIGPDGPLTAADVRVGFTLMAPDTLYPFHTHPAVELYWVIAGHSLWSGRDGEHSVAPGGFVLHRSGEPHAMRTLAEPLLALWSWSGDIDAPAAYCAA